RDLALAAAGQVDGAAGEIGRASCRERGGGGAAGVAEVGGGDAGDRLAEADVVAERGRLGDVVARRAAVGAGLQLERDRGRGAVDGDLGGGAVGGRAGVAGDG